MDFITFINETSVKLAHFARSNPLITIVGLIVLAIAIYRKPILFVFILFFCLLLVIVTYLIMGLTSPGPLKL